LDISLKTVLIAPLDWGLGHATRCMPLIDLLIRKQCRVIIAGNGDSFYLLKEQYPGLSFYELPGYNITYPSGKSAAVQGLLQAPKVFRTMREEHKMTAEIVKKEKIDVIISDNRYGVRHEKIKSIFICHHIALQAPSPMQFMNPLLLRTHLHQINKFDALWIPDEGDANNLSGKLSHGISFSIPHTYIGIQSRFADFVKTDSFIDNINFSILAVLSGPEPQRTFLEEVLKKKLKNTGQRALLVQGKTEKFTQTEEEDVTIISYLSTNDLYTALQKAKSIICRSGYSTVMDLAVMGKKAIFIPAEGQTEQEYLAAILSNKGYTRQCEQKDPDIKNAIQQLVEIHGFPVYSSSTSIIETELDKYLI
jgi:predicted glycosyltransferase